MLYFLAFTLTEELQGGIEREGLRKRGDNTIYDGDTEIQECPGLDAMTEVKRRSLF